MTEDPKVPRLVRWRFHHSVSSKLGIAAVSAATLCFLLLAAFQILQERALLKLALVERDSWTTQFLAHQLSDGIHWTGPDSIAAHLGGFTSTRSSNLEWLIAYDREGQELFHYRSDHLAEMGHEELDVPTGLPQRLRQSPEVTVMETGRQLTVAVPVKSHENHQVVGFLIAGWSLDAVDEILEEQLIPLTVLTGVMLLILIILLNHLIRRIVGRPLMDVALAVREVSKGNKTIVVPGVERPDEIGDMARAVKKFQQTIAMVDRLTAEQQHHAARLAQALEKEREYNALQKEFISMASHEFRTPLAIIDGTAQRVARRKEVIDSPEIVRRMETVRQEVERLANLVDSTLDSGRLDAGKLKASPELCNIPGILRTVCARQQKLSRKHRFELDLDRGPPAIWADPAHLDNIFTNLISNAVKYSPDGPRIAISVARDDAMVVISIRDHGIGIPEDEVPKLFQKYFRASTSQGLAGTGIGLHMVKHLVELHGGRVEVESEVAAGSLFRVTLPIGPVEAAADEQQASTGAGEPNRAGMAV